MARVDTAARSAIIMRTPLLRFRPLLCMACRDTATLGRSRFCTRSTACFARHDYDRSALSSIFARPLAEQPDHDPCE